MKTVIVGITLVIVMAVSVGGYWWYRDSQDNSSTQISQMIRSQEASVISPVQEPNGTPLGKDGEGRRCTWRMDTAISQGKSTEGTIYVSDNKMINISTLVQNGEKVVGSSMYSLIDGKYNFTWESGSSTGLKVPLSSEQPNFDQIIRMAGAQCESWTPDPSVFRVPSEITFQ